MRAESPSSPPSPIMRYCRRGARCRKGIDRRGDTAVAVNRFDENLSFFFSTPPPLSLSLSGLFFLSTHAQIKSHSRTGSNSKCRATMPLTSLSDDALRFLSVSARLGSSKRSDDRSPKIRRSSRADEQSVRG